jgi:hypothetical protein
MLSMNVLRSIQTHRQLCTKAIGCDRASAAVAGLGGSDNPPSPRSRRRQLALVTDSSPVLDSAILAQRRRPQAWLGGWSTPTLRPNLAAGAVQSEKSKRDFGTGSLNSPTNSATEPKTNTRTASSLTQGAATPTERDSLARTRRPWILHRTLDLATDRAVDREGVRRALSHRPCLEVDVARIGMELSETGTSSDRARRGGNPTMEEDHVARDKKKPHDLGPIWSSSTKAASCSFPTSAGRGPRRVKLRSCGTATNEIGSPPSRASRFRRDDIAWGSMFTCTPTTLQARRSSCFFATFCNIYEGTWSFFGTADRSIGRRS